MSYRGLNLITRQAIVHSTFRHANLLTRTTIPLASQDRGFFFGKRREPRCDLRNQSIVQEDGGRKAAWLGDGPLQHGWFDGALTTYSAIRRGPTVGGKEMLGTRVKKNGKLEWEWITYEQAIETSDHVSQAVRKLGIETGEESKIGIYSKNRPEWIISDMAVHNFSNVSVPLYDTITNDDMHYITNLCELKLMFVDLEEKTKQLIRDKSYLPTLKYIVQFDKVSPDTREMARENDFQIWSFEEFVEMGKKEKPRQHIPPTPETLATISFTSGTTGRPKGVMLTHLNLCSATMSCGEFEQNMDGRDGYLSYLPLAHIYERLCTLSNFTIGSRIGFFRGDPTLLLEDIQALGPVSVATVPRVIDKIHKGVMKQVVDKPIKRMILKAAIAYKLYHYKMTGKATRKTWVDKYLLHKIQMLLGPNIKQIIIGAAKSDFTSLQFMRGAFGIEVLEGYASRWIRQTKHNIEGKTYEQLGNDPVLAEDVLRHFVQLTEGHNRPRYEGVYAVHLTPIAFTAQNGLTTPTLKNKRNSLAQFFKSDIEKMYKTIETSELKSLAQ
ncbi:hypothetical protein CRE_14450 [Caenorhabditis remanei]|uniref:long-chain-fatty-acid--CoA ligase n=1 Tax=Caenorhabditis remanei TaxID=31234 RepID=E3NV69_CAERE|nr:hypothetical protein CRE_14450 [Caenorhabditis remanei]